MTPLTVRYTGLEIDPMALRERCHHGVIPPAWRRHRFVLGADVTYPVNRLNRWLQAHVEGRWSLYCHFAGERREITLAFEHEFDVMTFKMADGATQAFRIEVDA